VPLFRGRIDDGAALAMEINRFRQIYNTIRPHQARPTSAPARSTSPHDGVTGTGGLSWGQSLIPREREDAGAREAS